MTQDAGLPRHRIPSRWEQITPEWVTAAIAVRHPKAKVKDVTILTRDDGTNKRVRLGLTYQRGCGPQTLFLKTHETSHRSVHLRNGNLFNEARLFATRVPLNIEHPLIFKAMIDWLDVNYLLVMEDLQQRGADPRDATRPMTVDQVASGLRGLAQLHSQFWGTQHRKLRWVKTWAPTEGWQHGLKARIPAGLDLAADTLPLAARKFSGDEIVALWARYVATLVQGPMTLLHGDAHIGNTYVLPDGGVGFLDWQVVRRGEWSQDVGYFLVGCLTEEDRRRNERALLDEYRCSLTIPNELRPTPDELWLRYRASAAYGLAIWLSTLGSNGFQSREISMALTQRYAAAFDELETEKALANS
jgi:Phosphotransferase enzyme family